MTPIRHFGTSGPMVGFCGGRRPCFDVLSPGPADHPCNRTSGAPPRTDIGPARSGDGQGDGGLGPSCLVLTFLVPLSVVTVSVTVTVTGLRACGQPGAGLPRQYPRGICNSFSPFGKVTFFHFKVVVYGLALIPVLLGGQRAPPVHRPCLAWQGGE